MDAFQRQIVDLLPRARRLARALTRDHADADDLTQTALERALSRRTQWQEGTRLDAWLFRIMKNAWIDEARSRRRHMAVLEPHEAGLAAADPAVAPIETRLEARAVERAMAALPDDQRVAVALVLIEGFSYREAADILQLPAGTVASRLARGRIALMAQLELDRMSVSDERLIAYADGELDSAGRVEVEAALAADPGLAERLAAHQRLRARVCGAYQGALADPLPHAWLDAVATAVPGPVVDLADERARRPRGTLLRWGAMAACLAAGIVLGRLVLPAGPQDLVGGDGGALVAQGPLDRALTSGLASVPADPVRIGLSFHSRDGRYCRTFQAHGGLAGLACRQGDRWRVQVAVAGPPPARTQYQTAASSAPPAVLDAVDALIDGAPLDARAEAAARARGWRDTQRP